MPRTEGVQDNQAGLLTRILFFFAKRQLGHVPLGMRVRALVPRYFRNAVRMDLYGASKGAVPMHLKELAQLKTALLVGCPF